MDDEKKRLKETIEDLRKIIAEKNEKIEDLTSKVSELENKIEKQEKEIQELTEKIDSLTKAQNEQVSQAPAETEKPVMEPTEIISDDLATILSEIQSPAKIIMELKERIKKDKTPMVKTIIDYLGIVRDRLDNIQGTQRLCYAINQFSREIKNWHSRDDITTTQIKSSNLQKVLDRIDEWIDTYCR
ncbi:MAG: coiled-coil domain-containing protein [Candidatus Helarchaeales archaeon]